MRKNRKSPAPNSVQNATAKARAGVLAAAVVGPLLAAGVGFAPAAAAQSGPPVPASSNQINCRDTGTVKVCGKQGHSSLHAEPTVRMPQGGLFSNAWLPGYGRGHLPPILALD